jgi:hypothetical protein
LKGVPFLPYRGRKRLDYCALFFFKMKLDILQRS